MQFYLLILHLFSVAILIALVLIQQGKGADMGAAFGSGSAGSLFGASGSSNFLSKTTAIFALIFFLTSLSLTYLAFQDHTENKALIEKVTTPLRIWDLKLMSNFLSRRGGIGIHAVLRGRWLRPYEFESHRRHHLI